MKHPLSFLFVLLVFLFVIETASAQRLHQVTYYSDELHIIEDDFENPADKIQGNFTLSFLNDTFILDLDGEKQQYKILDQKYYSGGYFEVALSESHSLLLSEDLKYSIFGVKGAAQNGKFILSKKYAIQTQQYETLANKYEDADLRKGYSYLQNGKIDEAIPYFEKSAANGNVKSMNTLSEIYQYKRDFFKTAEWLERAAVYGDYHAEYNLGLLYDQKGDFETAISWYQKAAKYNHRIAQYNMGYVYYSKKENYKEAMKWFLLADENEYHDAGFYISRMYAEGLGVEKSMLEAHKWMQRSADLGSEYAEKALEEF